MFRLYACSILYKYKLPFILAMNKIDVVNHKYALDWMNDFEVIDIKLLMEKIFLESYKYILSTM